ncbi:hypothetical protein [Paenibacillus sp. N3.4]|uniref:hypothetical protein n=1 Tax=Paenibacillus sp. N3.4 TaxID=2603222 RepID=UPI0011C6FF0C|nr:hypothetical protein [Paenibacillus sp. N3.4]TXK82588.1 hypothetical protein FU659_14735 [Paenibacillus sp. N3.4]
MDNKHRTIQVYKHKPRAKDSDSQIIAVVVMVLLTSLFLKYNNIIFWLLTVLVLFGLKKVLLVSFNLVINKVFSKLYLWWISLITLLLYTAHLNLKMVQTPEYTSYHSIGEVIQNKGLLATFEYSYITFGLIGFSLCIGIAYILMGHLLAVGVQANQVRKNKFVTLFIEKTKRIIEKPIPTSIAISILCIISYVFTSGVLYRLIT